LIFLVFEYATVDISVASQIVDCLSKSLLEPKLTQTT